MSITKIDTNRTYTVFWYLQYPYLTLTSWPAMLNVKL